MERHGDQVEVTTTEARGGSTPHIVRYVLLISVVLAIVVLSVIWMTGAATSGNTVESGAERSSDASAVSPADAT